MIDRPLFPDVQIAGRFARADLKTAPAEAVRSRDRVREWGEVRMNQLLAQLRFCGDDLPLSGKDTAALIEQHLACKNASRLPVLVVAAAYAAAGDRLGEVARPLLAHNAADEQTGAVGDVEICLTNDDRVVTGYEMKLKAVSADEIDRAVQKIAAADPRPDNYVFVTTEPVSDAVRDYAATFYESTGGTEIAVLDCVGFVRHFLHLFHRLRTEFLNAYQTLLLAEPDSAVRQPLKEAFLSLRLAAESAGADEQG